MHVVEPPMDANYKLLGKYERLFEEVDLTELLEIKDGWSDIVGDLSMSIDQYTRDYKFPGFRFLTVTENNGELVIDHMGADPVIETMIAFATKLSLRTCTKCGNPGNQQELKPGMFTVLCERHAMEIQAKK